MSAYKGSLPGGTTGRLFAAAKADPRIAEEILFVAEAREADGASTLARKLVAEFFPQLAALPRGKHG